VPTHRLQLRQIFGSTWQPYASAVALLVAADALMFLGDRYLIHFGFPWALVSLLVIAATANIWGVRAALLVLVLSAVTGDIIVPDQHISYLSDEHFSWTIRIIRTILFGLCGGTLVVIAWQARVMRERAALRREVVQSLQRMVLPEKLVSVPGCDIAAHYRPSRQEEEVGGDFYDVFPVDAAQGLYGFFMGDVMGKGKEAAEHTAMLRYTARAYFGYASGPAEVMRRLNNLVEAQVSSFGSASLFLGLYHAPSGMIRYTNAGHEPPLLARADGSVEWLNSTGTLVGILANAPYEEVQIELGAGDVLLLVTDGVTEARDREGEFLDEKGTWRLLRPCLAAPRASGVVEQFQQRLEAFMAGRQRDDIAILLFRRLAPKPTTVPKSRKVAVKSN
jgi:hypothetical protein